MTSAAWTYHNATKHSVESVRADRHTLDWSNQPLPFKIYSTLAPMPLPAAPFAASAVLDRSTLARLCYFSNGITRVLRRPGGAVPFRAAACTGALYHIELYLVCGDVPGLSAGVYHYGAHDHALRQLRAGDFRAVLASEAPAVLICTSTFWRNSWKYQARAYRHSFWDTGTIVANLLAVAAEHDIPARVVLGFADPPVNALLDVQPADEAAICLVELGRGATAPPPAPSFERLDLPTEPLSAHSIEYPAITAMHQASSLADGAAVAAWRRSFESLPTLARIPSVEDVIRRRGSSRQFTHAPITADQLEALLQIGTQSIPSDVPTPLTTPYLIVNAVEGLAAGSYVYSDQGLQLLRAGNFRHAAALLDLGQPLAGDAAVNIYALADLENVLATYGDRGYRAAQLEGAIQAGRLYLSAYAQGLGATGLTFFDDDVSRFFGTDASVMFLTAIGHPASRRHG